MVVAWNAFDMQKCCTGTLDPGTYTLKRPENLRNFKWQVYAVHAANPIVPNAGMGPPSVTSERYIPFIPDFSVTFYQ